MSELKSSDSLKRRFLVEDRPLQELCRASGARRVGRASPASTKGEAGKMAALVKTDLKVGHYKTQKRKAAGQVPSRTPLQGAWPEVAAQNKRYAEGSRVEFRDHLCAQVTRPCGQNIPAAQSSQE